MKRKVLLVEPRYRNKYPPLGLMKLSTYHKKLGDEVTFYKGAFKDFIIEEVFRTLLDKLNANDKDVDWYKHKLLLVNYIARGHQADLDKLRQLSNDPIVESNLVYYKDFYRKKEYLAKPKWDRICISTLFTFYWKDTIDAINCFKMICKTEDEVWVGGTAASVVPDKIFEETGIKPYVGLLDRKGVLDDNELIIDHLELDYSILNEIDYKYPENNGYYGYMTRGCINKCPFCAVPTIEPVFNNFVSIKNQIKSVKERYGEKQNLLLLDNNVLASDRFNEIIDEIKECGFTADVKYLAPNEYDLSLKALRSGYNDKAYIKRIIELYKKLLPKLGKKTQQEAYELLKEKELTNEYSALKDNIIDLDYYFAPLFDKHHNPVPSIRAVDFNQGIDARLLTEEKAKKLSEIPIRPLRFAFDSWKDREVYEKAIRLTAMQGIRKMSNYLLYNYHDRPVDLYYRLRLNIDLCEELNISIYSFPMKYHPIQDPRYFKDRSYIGKHWNRKFIRTIQAVLNSTKGKIGKGKSFFEEAFGKDEQEFEKLLYMPETLIIYRFFYKDNGTTAAWWDAFNYLGEDKAKTAKEIICNNDFNDIETLTRDKEILNVLKYYTIRREDAEREMKA